MALSKKTGIAQSTISTAEREGHGSGETPVYARACGVSAIWLATGEGDMLDTSPPQANTDAPSPATLPQLMQGLSGYFEAMDASTRKMTLALLEQLADNPGDHARIAAMIELSIRSRQQKTA